MTQPTKSGRKVDPLDISKKSNTGPSQGTQLVTLDPILGMPPLSTYHPVMSNLYRNAIPKVIIIPCEPRFELGMTLFTPGQATERYKQSLADLGYSVTSPLSVAFIPYTPPTDSLNNEYGESFLNKITDVVSQAAQEVSYMFGARSLGEGVENLANRLQQGGAVAGGIGTGLKMAKEEAGKFFNMMGPTIKGAADIVGKLMVGNRIDFPFVWKNSSFQTSTSITVRLYNPVPKNDNFHLRYIVGPLLALLALAAPLSDSPNVYSFPFLHKVYCRGLFRIDPATITGISVTRGAEGQISWGRRPSLVDVRIDFGSLYSVLLNSKSNDRPTLYQLKNTLEDEAVVEPIYVQKDEQLTTADSIQMGSVTSGVQQNISNIKTATKPAVTETMEAASRVSPEDASLAENLEGQGGF